MRAEVRVDSVDKGGFTRTGHANGDYHYWLFLVFLLFRCHSCSRLRRGVGRYLTFVEDQSTASANLPKTDAGRLLNSPHLLPPSSFTTPAN